MPNHSKSLVMLTLIAMSAAPTVAQFAPDDMQPSVVKPQRTARITGRVVDESGKPVGGLSLRAVISDADFARLTSQFWIPFTFKGAPGKSITGYSYKGPPPEDRIGRTMVCVNVPTAPDGSYKFSGLTTGRYYLMEGGNLDAGKAVLPIIVQAQEGETVQAPDVVVSRAVTIRGQLVSKEDGKPLPGVLMSYFDAVRPFAVSWFLESYQNRRGTLTTDKDGRFTVQTAPGAAQFFVAGSGASFRPKDLRLTARQQEQWDTNKDVYGQTVWGVKSGSNIYAANRWVEVDQQGQPTQELGHGQWLQTLVEPQKDVSLIFRLDKLAFKNGKIPTVPASSILHQGDPRKQNETH